MCSAEFAYVCMYAKPKCVHVPKVGSLPIYRRANVQRQLRHINMHVCVCVYLPPPEIELCVLRCISVPKGDSALSACVPDRTHPGCWLLLEPPPSLRACVPGSGAAAAAPLQAVQVTMRVSREDQNRAPCRQQALHGTTVEGCWLLVSATSVQETPGHTCPRPDVSAAEFQVPAAPSQTTCLQWLSARPLLGPFLGRALSPSLCLGYLEKRPPRASQRPLQRHKRHRANGTGTMWGCATRRCSCHQEEISRCREPCLPHLQASAAAELHVGEVHREPGRGHSRQPLCLLTPPLLWSCIFTSCHVKNLSITGSCGAVTVLGHVLGTRMTARHLTSGA